MHCSNCGAALYPGQQRCPSCGVWLTETGSWPPPHRLPVSEDALPPQFRPLGAWAYFGYTLLFSIPVLGLILLIVYSTSNDNINRRNFARSFWCWLVIALAFALAALLLGVRL